MTGVRASTFHSAALSQLRYFRPDAVGKILASKTLLVYNLVRALPAPFKFRAAGDFATEIEWARNRRIPPSRYRDSLDGHAPPVPDDVMHRVYEQLRADQARPGADGLRGPARARDRGVRRRARRARRVPRALPRVHGRRVPGREPAAADAARRVARAARRPLRRRRRLPVDLRLHRRDAGLPARRAGALPAPR